MATIHFYASTGVYYDMDDAGRLTEVNRRKAWRDRNRANHYLSFADTPTAKPTEAQRRVLAARYLRQDLATLPASPNNQVCQWAFADLGGPDDISKLYGDGRT